MFSTKKLLVIILLAIISIYGCKTYYHTTTENFTVAKAPADVERGKNLCFNICAQCHYDYKSTMKFVGMPMDDLPKMIGKVYSANITNSRTHGIATYTDAELAYLVKTGITRTGRYIPYMIRPTIADKDLDDIIAYLRSDDEPVKAADVTVGTTRLSFIGKIGLALTASPMPYHKSIQAPPESDAIATGRYLVDIIGCYHCHSKSISGLNYLQPERSKGYMQGGYRWKINGERIYASNLTMDKETGIGNYTKMDFRNAVREGKAPSGRELRHPMRRFKHMTDRQADDIFAYLQTLPPEHHAIRGH
jgi:mono/diheme cytochrome c family protein